MEKHHANIPVFIPHLGCPNQCVFCNQRTISGTAVFCEASVPALIEKSLETLEGRTAEIAFFGGSFTGIDRSLMIRLLDTAQRYVDAGKVDGIRMSTRPDYIDSEIISILKDYKINAVELGIQSMDDSVLAASKRGHTPNDSVRAITSLKDAGFAVAAQMMLGLPKSTPDSERACAEAVCKLGVDGARIYPTLVFSGTELCDMAKAGSYKPLTVDEAVTRGSAVLEIFNQYGVPCIRIGLCDSENLHSNSSCCAGPNHPALGEMIRSEVWFREMDRSFAELDKRCSCRSKSYTVTCPCGMTSQLAGQKRRNIIRIREKYGVANIKILENTDVLSYNIKIAEI